MKRYLLLLCVALTAIIAKAEEADEGIVADSWDYEAQIHEDNTWDVTETITVTYLQDRHGIYRYIPRLFKRQHGTNGGDAAFTYYISIDDVEVEEYSCVTEDSDDSQENLVIRIGDEDVLVHGQHTYVIRYRLQYPDDRYTVSDELSHVLLGPDWRSFVKEFTFHLYFDKELPEGLNLHAFSGKWGSTENPLHIQPTFSKNEICGSATNIQPYTGISIRAELPEGYWVNAEKASPSLYYASFGIFCVLFLIALFLMILNRRKRPTVVIEYNAPEGISSAEVGVIIDTQADLSDLTSLIVWFASKGYLKIREIKNKKGEDDIELIKLKNLPKDAPKYQHLFWDIFFKKDNQKRLSELTEIQKDIEKALKALHNTFKGERKLTEVHMYTLLSALGAMAAGAIALCSNGCVAGYPEDEIIYGICFWLLPVVFAFFLRLYWSNYDMIKGKMWHIWQFVALAVMAGFNYLVCNIFFEEHNTFATLPQLLIISMGGWVLVLFAGRTIRDTAYRLQQMSLLLGFKEFIKKSELPMLQAMADENPSYFYDVLPYAMVFGLTKKWKKHFEKIQLETPDWYEGNGNLGTLSSLMVADRLTNHVSSSITKSLEVSSHSTSSSSGFGGGFSGGGGGGGGSW